MSWESIWPIALMIILSMALSRKKKRPEVSDENEDETQTPPDESPWDEMMREIRKRAAEAQRQAEAEANNTPTSAQETQTVPIPSVTATEPKRSQISSQLEPPTSDESSYEEVEVPTQYSFDAEAVQSFERGHKFSYEEDADTVSLTATPNVTPNVLPSSTASASSDSEHETKPSLSDEPDKPLFPDGFDPRMAVLYSEIFQRRY